MAQNFWTSSHCTRWLLQQRSKARPRKEDVDLLASARSVHAVRYYYLGFLSQLAQRCRLRQRVVATGQVFFRRFYTQHALAQHDPALIAVTALLVAAKVEECAINAKAIVKQLQPAAPSVSGSGGASTVEWPYCVSDVLECEYCVLQALLFDLVVFHPYRPLVHFLSSFQSHERYGELAQRSWELVNESYYSDVVMLQPPYVIAISCLYMAAHMLGVDYRAWLRAIATPQPLIADCTHQILQHIDRREQLHSEAQHSNTTHAATDALGCSLHGRLLEALTRLRQHHEQQQQWRAAGRKGEGGLGAGAEQRAEDERSGDRQEKAAGDEAEVDAAAEDAVVVLDDEQDCAVVEHTGRASLEEDAEGAARKKQKIDDG